MKEVRENRLVYLLRNNISVFNRYITFCLSHNDDFKCNLIYANLRGLNLFRVDFRGVNLFGADLRDCDLRYANLRGANIKYVDFTNSNLWKADLRDSNVQGSNFIHADLRDADLRGANIDFSCLTLSCRSLTFKSDLRIRTQIGFHFASLIKNSDNATDEEKNLLEALKPYVNKIHRKDVELL